MAAGVFQLARYRAGPTIRAVMCGQLCIPQEMRHHFQRPAFSFREKQVLQLVARGMTNGEIAHALYLAESTVKSHLSSSFRKLGVGSRKEAAAIVLDGHDRPDAQAPEDSRDLLGLTRDAKDVGDLTAILCAALEDSHAKSAPVLNRMMARFKPKRAPVSWASLAARRPAPPAPRGDPDTEDGDEATWIYFPERKTLTE